MEPLEATVRIIEALGPLTVLAMSGGSLEARQESFRQGFPELFEVIYDAARGASLKDIADRPD